MQVKASGRTKTKLHTSIVLIVQQPPDADDPESQVIQELELYRLPSNTEYASVLNLTEIALTLCVQVC